MAKRIMTRATLAQKAPFRSSTAENHRQILGPILLAPMRAGGFELYYSAKGYAATIAILDGDDQATIDREIDLFIADSNRLVARTARAA